MGSPRRWRLVLSASKLFGANSKHKTIFVCFPFPRATMFCLLLCSVLRGMPVVPTQVESQAQIRLSFFGRVSFPHSQCVQGSRHAVMRTDGVTTPSRPWATCIDSLRMTLDRYHTVRNDLDYSDQVPELQPGFSRAACLYFTSAVFTALLAASNFKFRWAITSVKLRTWSCEPRIVGAFPGAYHNYDAAARFPRGPYLSTSRQLCRRP